jgi:hypothetical protein
MATRRTGEGEYEELIFPLELSQEGEYEELIFPLELSQEGEYEELIFLIFSLPGSPRCHDGGLMERRATLALLSRRPPSTRRMIFG